jgi:hypothetical protein
MASSRRYVYMMLVGAGIALACVAVGAAHFPNGALRPSVTRQVPGRFDLSLSAGPWAVYQLTGDTHVTYVGGVSVNVTHQGAPTVDSSMMAVTAPGGHQLPVHSWSLNSVETLQEGSKLFTAVASFGVPTSGDYVVSVHSPSPAYVVVARPLSSVVVAALPWLGGVLAGGICSVVGLLMYLKHRSPAALAPATDPSAASGSGPMPA